MLLWTNPRAIHPTGHWSHGELIYSREFHPIGQFIPEGFIPRVSSQGAPWMPCGINASRNQCPHHHQCGVSSEERCAEDPGSLTAASQRSLMAMLECRNGLSHVSRGRPRGRFKDGEGGVPKRTSIARLSMLWVGRILRHGQTAQSDGRRWPQWCSANLCFLRWQCFGPYPAT